MTPNGIRVTNWTARALLPAMRSSFHVLAVEDDEADARIIERIGLESGLISSLRVLSSAEEAQLYLAGEGQYADRSRYPLPSLMLLDLKLRRMSGLEFLRWIRQNPAFRGISVIVLSGAATASDLNRAYELGIEAYIVKPVRLQGLSTMLAGVLVTMTECKPAIAPRPLAPDATAVN